jgi:hypothetical protein
MPTQSITPPATHQIPPTEDIFDAVFERSRNFRVELPYDTAIAFIRRIDTYNAFEAGRVIDALEHADRLIPRINSGPGNPNNGNRDYRIIVGSEGSPVIYLERTEFATAAPMAETAMKDICEEMRIWALADEADYEVHDSKFCGPSRKITFRFWWD